jgi:hypothetical protein
MSRIMLQLHDAPSPEVVAVASAVAQASAPLPCPTCARLRNLYLTGEFHCPRCGGPSPEVAEALAVEYARRPTA